MIELLLLIIMAVASVRSANTLRKHRGLFVEFGSSTIAMPLICLFPLAPLTLFVFAVLTTRPVAGAVIAAGLFLPGIIAVRKARAVFEKSGTDRTVQVQEALSVAFISGVGGIAYVAVATGIRMLVRTAAPVG